MLKCGMIETSLVSTRDSRPFSERARDYPGRQDPARQTQETTAGLESWGVCIPRPTGQQAKPPGGGPGPGALTWTPRRPEKGSDSCPARGAGGLEPCCPP